MMRMNEVLQESLVHHDARSNTTLLRRLERDGLYIRGEVIVPRDGNCLYWSIADQLILNGIRIGGGVERYYTGDDNTPVPIKKWSIDFDEKGRELAWRTVKSHIMQVIKELPELLTAMNLAQEGKDYDDYMKDGEWGISECICAAATYYKRNFHCYHSDRQGGNAHERATLHVAQTTNTFSDASCLPPLLICSWGNHFGSVSKHK